MGRIIGPLDSPPLDKLKVSPVGLVPKSDGSCRLITHLSFPTGESVNDGIYLVSFLKFHIHHLIMWQIWYSNLGNGH